MLRERKSAPPLKQPYFTQIKAREMPDFSRIQFKPIKDSGELTIPEGFNLASLRRHTVAQEQLAERLEKQEVSE